MGTNIPKQPNVPKMPSYNSVKSELDLISREATLEAFADYVAHGMSMNDYDALEDIVIHMPSVSTKKTGRWEMCEDADGLYGICSVCGVDADFRHYGIAYKWCPNCGAKMVESEGKEV